MTYIDKKKLAKELIEMRTITSISTGKKILNQSQKNIYDLKKDGKIMNKIEKNLRKIFYRCIDKESLKKLMDIINTENQIINNIFDECGWLVTREGVWHNNFLQNEEYSKPIKESYNIIRTQNGFTIKNKTKQKDIFLSFIQQTEENFLQKYNNQLIILHLLMCEEEKIMFGDYILENINTNYDTMNIIASLLGYENFSQNKSKGLI